MHAVILDLCSFYSSNHGTPILRDTFSQKTVKFPIIISRFLAAYFFLTVKLILIVLCYSAARPEQVFYGGEVKGESAMTYFDDVGTRIVHTYQVLGLSKSFWQLKKTLKCS